MKPGRYHGRLSPDLPPRLVRMFARLSSSSAHSPRERRIIYCLEQVIISSYYSSLLSDDEDDDDVLTSSSRAYRCSLLRHGDDEREMTSVYIYMKCLAGAWYTRHDSGMIRFCQSQRKKWEMTWYLRVKNIVSRRVWCVWARLSAILKVGVYWSNLSSVYLFFQAIL